MPRDAPRFCAVPCSPPASFVSSGGDGGHDHVAELRHQEPGADPEEDERHGEGRPVQGHVDRPDEHERSDRHRAEADLDDGPRPEPHCHLRPGERSGQHRDRHREEPLARLERVEAEHDLEVHRQDEERAHHDQLLRAKRGQPAAQRLDLQQRAVEERAPAEPLAALLPRQEAAEDDEAADDQERHQREPERRDLVPADRRRGDRLDPAPGAALQDPEHDQRRARPPRAPRRRSPASAGAPAWARASSAGGR